MTKRVAVFMGGWSAEREVSLDSGRAVTDALRTAGYDATAIDVTRDLTALLAAIDPPPEVVFNALHGRYGEDGCFQGLLNIVGIPYTHSGLLASALAMHKPTAKALFAAEGLRVAEDMLITVEQLGAGHPMAPPYVVKPLNEGSSVGVHIVREGNNRPPHETEGWALHFEILVERFIHGRELTVAVMGKGDEARAMTVTEIATHRGFYDYDAKYAEGGSVHIVPAEVDADVFDEAMDMAVRAHRVLGCRGVSRADFRFDGGQVFILEVNTQPGMTATSLVPEQANHIGMSFPEICAWMVEQAQCDE
jgi:D-alanine-D-alanine ligase